MDDLADTAAPTIDSARFRQVLGHFCSGITIITDAGYFAAGVMGSFPPAQEAIGFLRSI